MSIRKEIMEKIMWPKKYRDYPIDTPLVQQQVETGKGICGCEMHEINGWGNTLHNQRRRGKGNERKSQKQEKKEN